MNVLTSELQQQNAESSFISVGLRPSPKRCPQPGKVRVFHASRFTASQALVALERLNWRSAGHVHFEWCDPTASLLLGVSEAIAHIARSKASRVSATTGERNAPRYFQLTGELRAEILSGKFAVSDQFPTESELCLRHAVSRFTVREALRRLQNEGLIARRRGSGMVVQPAAARGGTLHQPLSNVGEILQYARDTRVRYEPAGRGPLPKAVAEQIGEGTLFSQIERLPGVSIGKVNQDIQAVPASTEIANALGLKRGAAVLRNTRCYLNTKGRLFEISVSHHPGDRFAYSMHIDVEG